MALLPLPDAHNSNFVPASFPNRVRETVLLLLLLLMLLLLLVAAVTAAALLAAAADAVTTTTTTTTLGYWMLGRRLFCSLIITTAPFFNFRFYYYCYYSFYISHLYALSSFFLYFLLSHTITLCPHRCLTRHRRPLHLVPALANFGSRGLQGHRYL